MRRRNAVRSAGRYSWASNPVLADFANEIRADLFPAFELLPCFSLSGRSSLSLESSRIEDFQGKDFQNKKAPRRVPLLLHTAGGLRGVVAHSGEDHVGGRLGSAADTGPCLAGEVAVGALVLQTAELRAGVDTVGEAGGAFDYDTGCAPAVCRYARVVGSPTGEGISDSRRRQGLGVAARVGCCDGSIANELGWRVDRAEIDRALRVLGAGVSEDVELRRGMGFDGDEALIRL